MKQILLIGAGRSSSALIKYLLNQATGSEWLLTVADASEKHARTRTGSHPSARAIGFDVNNTEIRESEIKNAYLVISLLPPSLHQLVAEDCIKFRKHFLTASYLTPEMKGLHEQAVASDIIMLNECGLDPGIDHMSAMQIIDKLKQEGFKLLSFKSYTGGLIAPESNDNPWGYKFTWNPRNVILAGQGTARYIENGTYKYLPYQRLFQQTEPITVDGYGKFDGYANRDSLAYRLHYKITDIPTLIRGTLRQEGFCKAWNVFVQLGLTDDSFTLENSEQLTYAQIVRAFIPGTIDTGSVENDLASMMNIEPDGELMKKIKWTGILDEQQTLLPGASPANILQHLLEKKWKLKEEDKDMIVMQHQFEYLKNERKEKIISTLVVKGEDADFTAMSKTVGLPLGIAAKLILDDRIQLRGVHIPVKKEIYDPILSELAKVGIQFLEQKFSE